EFQQPFQLDDYEDTHPGLFCMVAESSDESATTYSQIMRSPHRDEWQKAMEEEMQSLHSHKTWQLAQLPPGKKAIGCRWLFKVKRNADGTVSRYKARLCAKGFTQKPGVDFHETFAPVARVDTIRCMLAIAAQRDYEIQQFD